MPFQESEVLRLLLGAAAGVILALGSSGIRRMPGKKLFMTAYYVLFSGWIFTVFEHVIIYEVLNALEHISYFVSAALYLIWCTRIILRKSER